MKRVCVLGAGAWGTAFATVLVHNGITVNLWSYEKDLAQHLKETHENKCYLPGVVLDEKIHATDSLSEAIDGVEWIFEAVPVPHLRAVLDEIKPYHKLFQRFIVLSKGIEQKTCLLPTTIIQEVLGDTIDVAVIAGPSFARELTEKQLTGVVVASNNQKINEELKDLLENEYFKVFMSDDVTGVQVCSALKNVIAVGVGLLDGAGYKDNTKAFFMVQALREVKQIMHIFKSTGMQRNATTLEGLAGIGDLVLTAFGKSSKNLLFGALIGQGLSLEQAQQKVTCLPEGVFTLVTLKEIVHKHKTLQIPVLLALCGCIHEKKSISYLLDLLVCD